ncbi:uncharacterized protein LOC116615059 isoform X2 [Nematostella vectensis]|nr:uncharacterized protein LOC116615059 isoform X2 [Nematostella vectensis]
MTSCTVEDLSEERECRTDKCVAPDVLLGIGIVSTLLVIAVIILIFVIVRRRRVLRQQAELDAQRPYFKDHIHHALIESYYNGINQKSNPTSPASNERISRRLSSTSLTSLGAETPLTKKREFENDADLAMEHFDSHASLSSSTVEPSFTRQDNDSTSEVESEAASSVVDIRRDSMTQTDGLALASVSRIRSEENELNTKVDTSPFRKGTSPILKNKWYTNKRSSANNTDSPTQGRYSSIIKNIPAKPKPYQKGREGTESGKGRRIERRTSRASSVASSMDSIEELSEEEDESGNAQIRVAASSGIEKKPLELHVTRDYPIVYHL